jgi:hypothetical protein
VGVSADLRIWVLAWEFRLYINVEMGVRFEGLGTQNELLLTAHEISRLEIKYTSNYTRSTHPSTPATFPSTLFCCLLDCYLSESGLSLNLLGWAQQSGNPKAKRFRSADRSWLPRRFYEGQWNCQIVAGCSEECIQLRTFKIRVSLLFSPAFLVGLKTHRLGMIRMGPMMIAGPQGPYRRQ